MDIDAIRSWAYWDWFVSKSMVSVGNLIAAIVIVLLGKWLAGKMVRLAQMAIKKAKVDSTLVGFLGNVLNVLLMVFVLMAALNKLGVPTTSAAALIGGRLSHWLVTERSIV